VVSISSYYARGCGWNFVWPRFLWKTTSLFFITSNNNFHSCTVKPVYNGHPWDFKILAVVDRWPLLAGGRCSEVAVNTGLTVLIFVKCVLTISALYFYDSRLAVNTMSYHSCVICAFEINKGFISISIIVFLTILTYLLNLN
jgi:hypothetical protein